MARARCKNPANSSADLGFEAKQFYTPQSVVGMLPPNKAAFTIPAAVPRECSCTRKNSSKSTGCKFSDISIYGQNSNATTRRLAMTDFTVCVLRVDFGFSHDLHSNPRSVEIV